MKLVKDPIVIICSFLIIICVGILLSKKSSEDFGFKRKKKVYTGCPTNIVLPGIRVFDIKGPSKNFNSINLA